MRGERLKDVARSLGYVAADTRAKLMKLCENELLSRARKAQLERQLETLRRLRAEVTQLIEEADL